MWKYPKRLSAFGLAMALAATLLSACSLGGHGGSSTSVEVQADKPGTYQLGDVTVSVPAGAVTKNTKLTATSPSSVDRKSAPLGAASVQFDLSFEGGVEPKQPLDVAIKLQGDYLPAGANPAHALLYTTVADGKVGQLVPATIDGNVLHAKLNHLSPKAIVYPTDEELLAAAGIRAASAQARPDCQTSVATKAAGKVLLTDANKGWDNKKDSPITACLSADGDNARLTVTNNVNYALDVFTTNGLKLNVDAPSIEQHAIEQIASAAFHDRRIVAYLHQDASFSALLPPANLPATVEMRADADTFLAQAAWNSLKFLVAVAEAKGGGELVEDAGKVLKLQDNLDCITSALKTVTATQPSLKDVFDAIVGPCANGVMNTIRQVTVPSGDVWSTWFKRFVEVPVAGVTIIWQTVASAFTGIQLQFVGAQGTIRIVVAAEAARSDWIKPFVGEWHSYRSWMRINADGTGSTVGISTTKMPPLWERKLTSPSRKARKASWVPIGTSPTVM